MSIGGVLVEGPGGELRLAAPTSEEMQVVEEGEISHEEGPCLDAYTNDEQVLADELRDEFDRWPTVAPWRSTSDCSPCTRSH